MDAPFKADLAQAEISSCQFLWIFITGAVHLPNGGKMLGLDLSCPFNKILLAACPTASWSLRAYGCDLTVHRSLCRVKFNVAHSGKAGRLQFNLMWFSNVFIDLEQVLILLIYQKNEVNTVPNNNMQAPSLMPVRLINV